MDSDCIRLRQRSERALALVNNDVLGTSDVLTHTSIGDAAIAKLLVTADNSYLELSAPSLAGPDSVQREAE